MSHELAVRQKLATVSRSRDEMAVNISNSGKSDNNFVYVNPGYVHSMHSLNAPPPAYSEPPTSVIREQYCICAKWPKGQKFLAIAVGLLLGTLIGLSVSYALKISPEDTVIGSIFRQPDPAASTD